MIGMFITGAITFALGGVDYGTEYTTGNVLP